MKKLIAGIAAVMILACGCAAGFADGKDLSREEAVKTALEYAGLQEDQVTFTKIRMDRDDGRQIWEVDFVFDGDEYETDVDVSTGRILECDVERYHGRDDDRDDRDEWDDWFDFD